MTARLQPRTRLHILFTKLVQCIVIGTKQLSLVREPFLMNGESEDRECPGRLIDRRLRPLLCTSLHRSHLRPLFTTLTRFPGIVFPAMASAQAEVDFASTAARYDRDWPSASPDAAFVYAAAFSLVTVSICAMMDSLLPFTIKVLSKDASLRSYEMYQSPGDSSITVWIATAGSTPIMYSRETPVHALSEVGDMVAVLTMSNWRSYRLMLFRHDSVDRS